MSIFEQVKNRLQLKLNNKEKDTKFDAKTFLQKLLKFPETTDHFTTLYTPSAQKSYEVNSIIDYIYSLHNEDRTKLLEKSVFSIPNIITLQPTKDYMNSILNKHSLDGQCTKEFLKCNSKIFTPLFDEIRNNKSCAYHTYLDNAIKSNPTNPENIIVLSKVLPLEFDAIQEAYSEVVCSRLLNLLGITTTYNQLCTTYQESTNGDYLVPKYDLLSVNFVGEDEKFKSIAELSGIGPFKYRDRFEELQEQMLFSYAKLARNINKTENYDEDEHSVMVDFYKSYITRVFAFNDYDFTPRNMGLLYNEQTNEIKFAPNYDMEASGLVVVHNIFNISDNLNNSLQTFKNYDNNEYKKYISTLQNIVDTKNANDNSKLEQTILDACNGVHEIADNISNDFVVNISCILERDKKISGVKTNYIYRKDFNSFNINYDSNSSDYVDREYDEIE